MLNDTRYPYVTGKLSKNLILEDSYAAVHYRILYVSNEREGYWIRIDSSSNIPKPFLQADVVGKIQAGLLVAVPDIMRFPDDDSLSPNEALRRDKAWNLIHNIVTMEPDIYIPSKRREFLNSIELVSGVSIPTIYGYLGKYWRGGFQPNALAPDYSQCGGARKATSLENRPGRHKIAGNNGKVLNKQDIKNFEQAVKKYLRNGMGITATYNAMLADAYVLPRFEGDPMPTTMDADEKPSFNQFYYWYKKHGDVVGDTEASEGENRFAQKHRGILGKTETYLAGPGDSYQIDATIGDFYLVMESDRSRLVGRPVIVFIKDAWSRMVVGMSVTLENSSFRVWREALLNAVSSKTEYCKRFDILIKTEDWPCDILPSSITTDNGEFAVKAVDEIVHALGITVENCPPYRGDLKGIIERTFETYQLELKPYIPGYVDKDAGQRRAEDYRKNSCLDIRTFTAIMIRIVLFYNNDHYMEKYNRTSDMREKGVPAIPRSLWNYGVKFRSGAQRTFERDTCLEALLEKDDATVTAKGIRLNGLHYSCDLAESERWFERARIEGNWTVPILYNPFLCKDIYLKGNDGRYVTCSLVEAFTEHSESTMEEVATAHKDDLKTQAAHTQGENQAYSDMTRFIKAEVDRCMGEKESGKVIIETLSKHSMDKNRNEEKKILSGETEACEKQAGIGVDDGNPGSQNGGSPSQEKPRAYEAVSSEIDRIMKELLGGARANAMQ